jgi:hypothetical protein
MGSACYLGCVWRRRWAVLWELFHTPFLYLPSFCVYMPSTQCRPQCSSSFYACMMECTDFWVYWAGIVGMGCPGTGHGTYLPCLYLCACSVCLSTCEPTSCAGRVGAVPETCRPTGGGGPLPAWACLLPVPPFYCAPTLPSMCLPAEGGMPSPNADGFLTLCHACHSACLYSSGYACWLPVPHAFCLYWRWTLLRGRCHCWRTICTVSSDHAMFLYQASERRLLVLHMPVLLMPVTLLRLEV